MAGNSRQAGTSVTSRALAILSAFDEQHRAMSLSDIATRADLPLATTHRLLGELFRWGALERLPSGDYVIGRKIWDIGHLAPTETGLRQVAEPFLHDLYGATLATVHLAVREGTEVVYLDRLRGNQSVPVVSKVGGRLPMHATGVGKVLLAHAPAEVQEAVLGALTRITPYTITQPGALRRQLRQVLDKGYATTHEEMSLGACSIAVPIHRRDEVVASLGLVVPTLKGSEQRLYGALRVAAQSIGRRL
ncbi:regulatory protein [Nocardioidaceae bacterium Broad-1]|uniref:IclR family transcriptional regulator n=1 Tax=Nocardioides luteus TaxID=1844 RepID=UPI0002028DF6|nr:IclR family transcriptional regulator [Nocardioides luteus]EGD43215.1 regulatory protein [Nocardioidaceae bacterium Broad-1]MBG6097910.1 DNA-binding IclR family transcriptional regulator [Nocardioides luteus]